MGVMLNTWDKEASKNSCKYNRVFEKKVDKC